MEEKAKYLQQINDIKNMMDNNTKFLSLSGLAGVWAGSTAIIGALVAAKILQDNIMLIRSWEQFENGRTLISKLALTLIGLGFLIFLVALAGGFYFTYRKAKKHHQKIWNNTSKKMLLDLLLIGIVGGIFCLLQIKNGVAFLFAPTCLIFYGIGLFTVSRYTVRDIKTLSICMMVLGLFNAYYIYHGILFWFIGFGILHIVYGIAMYLKYDRK
ncbi:MAG: hypothetical protein H6553_13485 [Chitinophagales bacterium]|nr:hypothetical protein [Chitinophagales bacterium]